MFRNGRIRFLRGNGISQSIGLDQERSWMIGKEFGCFLSQFRVLLRMLSSFLFYLLLSQFCKPREHESRTRGVGKGRRGIQYEDVFPVTLTGTAWSCRNFLQDLSKLQVRSVVSKGRHGENLICLFPWVKVVSKAL